MVMQGGRHSCVHGLRTNPQRSVVDHRGRALDNSRLGRGSGEDSNTHSHCLHINSPVHIRYQRLVTSD